MEKINFLNVLITASLLCSSFSSVAMEEQMKGDIKSLSKTLIDIPQDTQVGILSYLRGIDLLRVSGTCQALYSTAKEAWKFIPLWLTVTKSNPSCINLEGAPSNKFCEILLTENCLKILQS